MESFTEYYVLAAFRYRADGDFSYLWYGRRFTESVVGERYARVWGCSSWDGKERP